VARLSEMATRSGMLSAIFRLGEGVWRFEQTRVSLRREGLAQARRSRSGEKVSPKRDIGISCDVFVETSSRRGLCVVLGKGVTRPGERISPKREDLA